MKAFGFLHSPVLESGSVLNAQQVVSKHCLKDWITCIIALLFSHLHLLSQFGFPQDQHERNHIAGYWKQVGPVAVGSFCLFIFDMCER
jgi:hypothetical protein